MRCRAKPPFLWRVTNPGARYPTGRGAHRSCRPVPGRVGARGVRRASAGVQGAAVHGQLPVADARDALRQQQLGAAVRAVPPATRVAQQEAHALHQQPRFMPFCAKSLAPAANASLMACSRCGVSMRIGSRRWPPPCGCPTASMPVMRGISRPAHDRFTSGSARGLLAVRRRVHEEAAPASAASQSSRWTDRRRRSAA